MDSEHEYFRLNRDLTKKRRCWLDVPTCVNGGAVDVWAFTLGQPFSACAALAARIERPGELMDITFSHAEIPYIRPRVGVLLEAFAGWNIQRIPAQIDSGEGVEVLNVLTVIDCFDRARSDATYEAGHPKMVMNLRILPVKAEGHHVFRVKDWLGPLIVSNLILKHLERIGATGFVASKVS